MKIPAAALAALALAACSGNFSGGGGGGMTPPMNAQAPPNGSPASAAPANGGSPNAVPSGDTATYPFAQAPQGLQCPSVAGYSCVIRLNAPAPTPTPTATPKGKRGAKPRPKPHPTATPTASPTPAPSVTPTTLLSGSAAPSPGASGSASPVPDSANVTLRLAAMPKDAPPMNVPDAKTAAGAPLLSLRLSADGNVILDGTAIADFTLPADQAVKRAYAIQLFQDVRRGRKHEERFVGSFSDSTLDGTTLRFVFTPPKLEIKKDEVWLFVLYAAPLPSPSPGASSAASPSSSPSPTPRPSEDP